MKKYIYIILMLCSSMLKSAQPCAAEPSKEKSLKDAVFYGNLAEVNKLLQEGVKTKLSFHTLANGLYYKKVEPDVAQQIANSLLSYGYDINELNNYNEAPLIHAIKQRNVKAVRLFSNLGGTKYINGVDYARIPIFHLLTGDFRPEETYEIFDILISLGVDLNIKNNFKNTPLYVAVANLHKKLRGDNLLPSVDFLKHAILMLLINGAIIDGKKTLDYLKDSPESVAREFINYILEAEGVNEIKGAENALLIAGYLGDANLVNALLRKGVWFRSYINELNFELFIADKPDIKAMVNQHKHERDSVISENPNLIPDLSKIVSEY